MTKLERRAEINCPDKHDCKMKLEVAYCTKGNYKDCPYFGLTRISTCVGVYMETFGRRK